VIDVNDAGVAIVPCEVSHLPSPGVKAEER
jgi:hypothetical protein